MAFKDFSEFTAYDRTTQTLRATFARACANDFAQQVLQIYNEPRFRRNISLKDDYAAYDCWLTSDGTRGFAVGQDRELTNVFSTVRASGGGADVMAFVTSQYDALHLNCFEGTLERFYGRHGFKVTHREKNWLGEGHPGIVYMQWNR